MIWFMTSYRPLDMPPRRTEHVVFVIYHIQSSLWISLCHTQCWRIKVSPCSQGRGEEKGIWNLPLWNQVKVWGKATWSKDDRSWWCLELISPSVIVLFNFHLKIWRRLHHIPLHDLRTGYIWLTRFLKSFHYWHHGFFFLMISQQSQFGILYKQNV